jgi:hypothetical protein
MKRTLIVLITLGMMSLFFTHAVAGENLVQTVTDGCKVELEKYCKDVTPGEGRVLACLYAFGDKLSPKCEYALYDAAAQLERAVAALSYVANECDADLVPYHLVFCHKKQENHAAISRSCSVDAAKKAFNMFVNFTPLSVI